MMSPLPHTEQICCKLILLCGLHVCEFVKEVSLGPQWVALHKSVGAQVRFDRELDGWSFVGAVGASPFSSLCHGAASTWNSARGDVSHLRGDLCGHYALGQHVNLITDYMDKLKKVWKKKQR